jgi:hypothetical protein
MEPEFKQVNNLPLIMTPDQIDYAADVRGEHLPITSLIRDFFENNRAAVIMGARGHYNPVFNESLTLFYPAEDIVVHRRFDNPVKTSYVEKDGAMLISMMCHPHEPSIKDDTRLVFSKDTLLLSFNKKYDGDSPDRCTLDETRKRTITQLAVKQSIINVVKRRDPSIHAYMNGNDVLLNGNKIAGGEAFIYDHQYHENTIFTWHCDTELFDKYLKDDKNHINSLKKREHIFKGSEANGSPTGAYKGIAGVGDLIPGYTKKEFAEDILNEMKYFIFMAS